MKILITGAAGFLGRHFMAQHLDMGDDVIGIDNYQSPYAIPNDDVEKVDFLSYIDTEPAGQFDRVYHFAAMVGGREKIEQDPLYNASSLQLDTALFRWAVRSKPGLVIYPSSSAVYGVRHQTGDVPRRLAEGLFVPSDPLWDQPDSMYGFTKMAGEVLAYHAAGYGLKTLCIRPFSGYGADQSPEYPMRAIADRVIQREDPLLVWGSGSQVRDWVHVSDVVKATVSRAQAFESEDEGYDAMNIGTGKGYTFSDIARSMANIAGYRPDFGCITSKPEGVMYRVADTAKMGDHWEPRVTLDQGLREMLDG